MEEHLLTCYKQHRAQGVLPSTEVLRAAIVAEQAIAEIPAKFTTGFWYYTTGF
jgi:hypothetical protein